MNDHMKQEIANGTVMASAQDLPLEIYNTAKIIPVAKPRAALICI